MIRLANSCRSLRHLLDGPSTSSSYLLSRQISSVEFSESVFRWIVESSATQTFGAAFSWVHSSTGLPWWASIGIAAAGLKLVLLPIFVESKKNGIRVALVRAECPKLKEHIQAHFNRLRITKNMSEKEVNMRVWQTVSFSNFKMKLISKKSF